MLDVLSEIYRQRGQAAPDRRGADRSVHTVGYLIDPPDPVTYLCTVSVFDSEPISGVPATSMDYTDITAVHVLLDPFTGRPVHVLGPAGELPFGEVPFARDTRHVVTGHIVPPTSTGTYREDEAAWDRYSTMKFGGVTDVWQQGSDAGLVEWTDTAFETTDSTTYSFSGVDIGAADADRQVIFALVRRASASSSPSSIKINGDEIYSGTSWDFDYSTGTGGAGTRRDIDFGHYAVPTGTTADFEVTFGSSRYLCGIIVWRTTATIEHTGLESSSEWAGDHSAPAEMVVPTGGFALAAAYWESANTASSWTGATSDDHQDVGDGRTAQVAAAHTEVAGAVDITHTVVSPANDLLSAIAYVVT